MLEKAKDLFEVNEDLPSYGMWDSRKTSREAQPTKKYVRNDVSHGPCSYVNKV